LRASIRAMASSVPGSVSRIIFFAEAEAGKERNASESMAIRA
jgi:hypothetical protein